MLACSFATGNRKMPDVGSKKSEVSVRHGRQTSEDTASERDQRSNNKSNIKKIKKMAKISGINTKISGQVGEYLFRQTKYGTIVSEAPVRSSTPRRSQLQMNTRTQWANMGAIYRQFDDMLKRGFESLPTGMSVYNAFVQANLGVVKVYITKTMRLNGGCVLAPYQIPRATITGYRVIINTADETPLWDVVNPIGFSTVASSSAGIKVIATSQAIQSGAGVWVHSCENDSGLKVSTQFFYVENAALVTYQRSAAQVASANSYGGINTSQVFLQPSVSGSNGVASVILNANDNQSGSGSGTDGNANDNPNENRAEQVETQVVIPAVTLPEAAIPAATARSAAAS